MDEKRKNTLYTSGFCGKEIRGDPVASLRESLDRDPVSHQLSTEDMYRVWAALLLAVGFLLPSAYRAYHEHLQHQRLPPQSIETKSTVGVAVSTVSTNYPHLSKTFGAVQGLWLGKKMNLALVTASDLRVVPGIGERMAERIIGYRIRNGAFKTVEELEAVKGVGPKLRARLGKYVEVVSPDRDIPDL